MSKRQGKAQARSERAVGFGVPNSGSVFGSTSSLSYFAEPPDLSSISDPGVVVLFKNLSKKDPNTKAKALAELSQHVQRTAGSSASIVALLPAWMRLFPRLSLDADRRVRQLTFVVQGALAGASGKKIANHLPEIIGTWLAGSYDADKTVAMAASASLTKTFQSQEKIQKLWTIYRTEMLKFIHDILLRETALTLSDERVVPPDEAESNYSRVVAAALCLILLAHTTRKETTSNWDLLDAVLRDGKTWRLSHSTSAEVRKKLYRMLIACLSEQHREQFEELIVSNLPTISGAIVHKALSIDQSGSNGDLSQVLLELTKFKREVWTVYRSPKKTIPALLSAYFKKGSQNGGLDYWLNVCHLVDVMPKDALPKNLGECKLLLDALHEGIIKRNEPWQNLVTAWECYFSLVDRYGGLLQTDDDKLSLMRSHMLPIFAQFVRPVPDGFQLSLGPKTTAVEICGLALNSFLHRGHAPPALLRREWAHEWTRLTDLVMEDVKNSVRVDPQRFKATQDLLADEGSRWVALNQEALKVLEQPDGVTDLDNNQARKTADVIISLVDFIATEDGRPYGAAAYAASLMRQSHEVIIRHEECMIKLSSFLVTRLPRLTSSPSFHHLQKLLDAYSSVLDREGGPEGNIHEAEALYRQAFDETLSHLLTRLNAEEVFTHALQFLNSQKGNIALELIAESAALDEILRICSQREQLGRLDGWNLVKRVIEIKDRRGATTMPSQLLLALQEGLSIDEDAVNALQLIQIITREKPDFMEWFMKREPAMLAQIAQLSHTEDEEVASLADQTAASIQSLTIGEKGTQLLEALQKMVVRSVLEVGAQATPITPLAHLAVELLRASNDPAADRAVTFLPTVEDWMGALRPFLDRAPDHTLAITDVMGSSIYLVEHGHGSAADAEILDKDDNGYSRALRIAMYSVNVMSDLSMGDLDRTSDLLVALILTRDLTRDEEALEGANHVYDGAIIPAAAEIREFIDSSGSLISNWLDNLPYDLLNNLRREIMVGRRGLTPAGFYYARALIDVHGMTLTGRVAAENSDELNSLLKTKSDMLLATSIMASNDSSVLSHDVAMQHYNRITRSFDPQVDQLAPGDFLSKLVLLNRLIKQESVLDGILPHRLIPLTKNLVDMYSKHHTSSTLHAAEIARILAAFLPRIRREVSNYWATAAEFLDLVWSVGGESLMVADCLPMTAATLKLFDRMTSAYPLGRESSTTWAESVGVLSGRVVEMIKARADVPDDNNLPLRRVNELLEKQSIVVEARILEDSDVLLPLLFASATSRQSAAFIMSRSCILEDRSQVALEAALSTSTDELTCHLPDFLTQSIASPPGQDVFAASQSWGASMPKEFRGFLLCWMAVFVYLNNPAIKVSSIYIEELRASGSLRYLLDLTKFLPARDKARKRQMDDILLPDEYNFEYEIEPSEEADRMVIGLYHQALRRMPSLTKQWWINNLDSLEQSQLEKWTTDRLSGRIVQDQLNEVEKWQGSGVPIEFPPDLTLRIAREVREVVVEYKIDDQTLSIRITLPPSHPLGSVKVEGLNRVAVDEKKWQSWLKITHALIAFQNGSLIEGLQTWHKNVSGALTGKSECAICYSIISADRQLPSKKLPV
ncbi:MAG: hypothetical protein M1825_005710 [Sarcosagium campestre]|nr:MAG: hypothetical protein M1825_005710 [Sarcosagium campestre]